MTLIVAAAARYDDAHRPDESTTMDVMPRWATGNTWPTKDELAKLNLQPDPSAAFGTR